MKLLPLILACILLPSCATILNKKVQHFQIIPDKELEIIRVVQDTISLTNSFGYYNALRSKFPLEITYRNSSDSIIRKIQQKPFLSNSFWWNLSPYNFGLGILVDIFSKKKWAYFRKSYLTNSHKIVIQRNGNLKLFLPLEYSVLTENSSKVRSQYLGMPPLLFSIGSEYYYKDNLAFLSELTYGMYLIGGTNSRSSDESIRSVSVRNNHMMNNFELSYGLSLVNTTRTTMLGGSFGFNNMFTRVSGFRIVYEPYLLNLSNNESGFAYIVKVGMIFKINLKN